MQEISDDIVAKAAEAARRAEEMGESPIGNGDGAEMGSSEIMGYIREMQAFGGSQEERRAHFVSSRRAFRDACPTLFEMACRPGADLGMIEFMLKARDGMGAGEENEWAADKAVGQRLAERYLPRDAPPPKGGKKRRRDT